MFFEGPMSLFRGIFLIFGGAPSFMVAPDSVHFRFSPFEPLELERLIAS